MSAATRSSWDWLQIASLGEQLRSEDSLGAQRDRITAMANRLIEGRVDPAIRMPHGGANPLTPDEITRACQAAVAGGAGFVKTSTGFHPSGGATVAAESVEKFGISITACGKRGVTVETAAIRTGSVV